MRPFANTLYGIPPERVIGSALGLDFDASGDDTRLVYKSEIEFFDDGPQKPVRIWSRVGRRPLVAGGNSNGDIPMLPVSPRPGSRPGTPSTRTPRSGPGRRRARGRPARGRRRGRGGRR